MRLLNLFENKNEKKNIPVMPHIIAEAGVNHEGNFDLAKKLIDEAAEGGAESIKFQTYKAETIASIHSPSYWDLDQEPTKSQFNLFKKYDKLWKKDYEKLKIYCDAVGIEFLSTPFDKESAIFLDDLMDVFKISSSDITNKPFIDFICQFKKPIILSTGASFLSEIQEATDWVAQRNVPLAILHCILNYPTSDANANIGMMLNLMKVYPDNLIGYSDHTIPNNMKVLEIASLLGAKIIEKHFTFDKTLKGNDHYHSMDKNDLKTFKKNMQLALSIVGEYKKTSLNTEESARKNARRSLIAFCDIPAGKKIEEKHLTWKRPGTGISPKEIDKVLGRKVISKIYQDEILTWKKIGEI